MKIIKSLIRREWFRFFFGSSFVLVMLLTVANLVSGLLRGNVTAQEVLMNHFIMLPSYANQILPVSCLVASLFSINKLKGRNELTAIFAAGFNRKSYIATIAESSLFVAIALFLILGFIDPYVRNNRNHLISDSGSKFRNLKSQGLFSSTLDSGKIWYRTREYFFSFSSYDNRKSAISSLAVYFFRENKINQIIIANNATHKSHNYWTFKKGKILTLLDENTFPIEKNFDEMDFALNETPQDFQEIKSDVTTLNFFSLLHYISNLKKSEINTDEYFIIYLEKISSPIICIIFALIASLGIFNPNRRSSSFGKNLAAVFVFTMLFWLINSYFIEQGKSGNFDPYFSAFTIPTFFSVMLIFFFNRNRKLS